MPRVIVWTDQNDSWTVTENKLLIQQTWLLWAYCELPRPSASSQLGRVLWLGHTMNLSIPDLELLFPHGQLTVMLAEEIRA